uniref:Uncharacterized protein n=1 Tax=Arundo donax TaxID=35708 RepID=A0A0A9GGN4_ARUDO
MPPSQSLKACQNWWTMYGQMTLLVSWKPHCSSGNFFQTRRTQL